MASGSRPTLYVTEAPNFLQLRIVGGRGGAKHLRAHRSLPATATRDELRDAIQSMVDEAGIPLHLPDARTP